jgi:hypothetical protein
MTLVAKHRQAPANLVRRVARTAFAGVREVR